MKKEAINLKDGGITWEGSERGNYVIIISKTKNIFKIKIM